MQKQALSNIDQQTAANNAAKQQRAAEGLADVIRAWMDLPESSQQAILEILANEDER